MVEDKKLMPRRSFDRRVFPSIEYFAQDGCCRIPSLLDSSQIHVVNSAFDQYLASESHADWSRYREFAEQSNWGARCFSGDSRATTLYDCIGVSAELDATIEAILVGPLGDFLNRELGKKFKIWFAQVRNAAPGSASLRMHCDLPGEIGVNILLADTGRNASTTVAIPGSQRWPPVVNTLRFLKPSLFGWCCRYAEGIAGDAFVFKGSCWHGRRRGGSVATRSLILSFTSESDHPKERIVSRKDTPRLSERLKQAMVTE
ncbi:phytanoyl-CoA dioxygenase family protein [Rhodopirellula europaea]|uniref:phytanoyl-CoA dioxygenase family protein n=1 Tax=Rhodopirellula europaea TaxID=1263866 RepID=UPI00055DCD98